ncbi:hypothetical protein [Ferrimicrobium sp.]|uniref:hypothetical protein n=1 Tax=Ferrimicrobium sp. TaxID=2926050 RepID=UPI00261E20EC|nr:hypothetical protein [Ferrimicrobium sp.]
MSDTADEGTNSEPAPIGEVIPVQSNGEDDSAPNRPPNWLFGLELSYLGILVSLGLIYIHVPGFHHFLPDPVGAVPLAVPWWGALGGVTISLTGIFRNAKDWDKSYEHWHIARPFLGAVVGSVGFLVFIVVIRATGTNVASSSPTSRAAFDLIAFLVGYREQVFRQLLKRAADALLSPGRSSNE